MAGSPRNRAKNYGQSGGGGNMLANLVGAYFGMPEISGGAMLGGEEMAAMGGPEAVIGAAEPAVESLKVEKPGFWQNMLTKGQAGQNYANLDANIKLGNYDNLMKQEMLKRQITGQAGNIKLRDQLEAVAREDAYKKAIEEANIKDAINRGLGLNTDLRDAHVVPNTLATLEGDTAKKILENSAYQQPKFQEAHLNNLLAGLNKQPLANKETEGKIATEDVVRPTKAYMDVGNKTKVNPVTGQAFSDIPPLFEEPLLGKEGGLRNFNVGSGMGFSEKPGGIVGEVSQGGGNSAVRGVPWSIAKPSLIPQLPNFAFPEPPKQALPPGYEPYRKHIEQTNAAPVAQENPPIIPQPATPMPGAMPIPGMSQQDKIMQWLRRPRPGFPSEFNPYTIR
jgi:hypothetical protein